MGSIRIAFVRIAPLDGRTLQYSRSARWDLVFFDYSVDLDAKGVKSWDRRLGCERREVYGIECGGDRRLAARFGIAGLRSGTTARFSIAVGI